MRLTWLSVRATAAEHLVFLSALICGFIWGAVRLPLPVEVALPPDVALIWACVIACASGVCLRPVLPWHDDIPRRPQPMWAAGRVLVIVGTSGFVVLAVLLFAPAGEGDEVHVSLARNIAALIGLTLLTRRLPWGVWSVLPWLWVFAALLLGRDQRGQIEAWALPMAEPLHGWPTALALLLIGSLVHVVGELRRG